MMSGIRRSLDPNASVPGFHAEIGIPRPGGNGDVHGISFSGYADLIRDNDSADGLVDLRALVGHRHLKNMSRAEQSRGVIHQPEDRRAIGRHVDPNALEDTRSVM